MFSDVFSKLEFTGNTFSGALFGTEPSALPLAVDMDSDAFDDEDEFIKKMLRWEDNNSQMACDCERSSKDDDLDEDDEDEFENYELEVGH